MHKPETVVYAAAFLADHIEDAYKPLELAEDATEQAKAITGIHNEHRAQIQAMMKVVSEGVDELVRENLRLRNRLAMVQGALQS